MPMQLFDFRLALMNEEQLRRNGLQFLRFILTFLHGNVPLGQLVIFTGSRKYSGVRRMPFYAANWSTVVAEDRDSGTIILNNNNF